jgi:acyl carrier protein
MNEYRVVGPPDVAAAEQVPGVVVEEWCRVLDVRDPSRDDDFFAEGGNSLMVAALIDTLERRLGIEFPIEVMFLDGTLGALIDACVARHTAGPADTAAVAVAVPGTPS